ncbi:hypothetical protein NL676_005639 [Syzygium grande]|nr:hypothetical protein NL676_005639 [Syzygium grande]
MLIKILNWMPLDGRAAPPRIPSVPRTAFPKTPLGASRPGADLYCNPLSRSRRSSPGFRRKGGQGFPCWICVWRFWRGRVMADQGLEGSQPVDLSKHPSGIVPTLQNIVSTVNLDCKLDLKAIALQARNAEYNPKRFAAVIMRIREPKTTALIFASGKMVCTGAKSEQQSKLAARKYARIIQKLGFPAKFKDFKIQNIVGSCDVKFPIRLEGLAYSHGAFSSYEPELFPGLIYRMKQPKIVLLIFVSGKIVLTGAKVRDETYTAFENIYPVLTEFRKIQQWYSSYSFENAAAFFVLHFNFHWLCKRVAFGLTKGSCVVCMS